MKQYVVICKYGGMRYVAGEFDTKREALDLMGKILDGDGKRTGRGARVAVVILKFCSIHSN